MRRLSRNNQIPEFAYGMILRRIYFLTVILWEIQEESGTYENTKYDVYKMRLEIYE